MVLEDYLLKPSAVDHEMMVFKLLYLYLLPKETISKSDMTFLKLFPRDVLN